MKHRHILTSLILGAILCAIAPAAHASEAQERAALTRENARIEAEIKLASKPGVYFILDTANQKLIIKTHATVLRELGFTEAHIWGKDAPPGPYTLKHAAAMKKAKRKEIIPGSEKNDDLDFFDVHDMPADFRLIFENGLVVTVTSSSGAISGLAAYVKKALWQFTQPFKSVRRGKDSAGFSVWLGTDELTAKSIYWSATPGSSWLVLLP